MHEKAFRNWIILMVTHQNLKKRLLKISELNNLVKIWDERPVYTEFVAEEPLMSTDFPI